MNFQKLTVEEIAAQRDDLQNKLDKYQEMDSEIKRWKKRCDEFRDLNEDLQHEIDDKNEEQDNGKIGRSKDKKKLEDRLR